MATQKKTTSKTTSKTTPQASPQQAPAEEVEEAELVTPTVTVAPNTVRARVKGTWTMYYCGQPYDFTDGSNYDLPPDLYNYLKGHGNIYDTL
jgi:hypothetical protein